MVAPPKISVTFVITDKGCGISESELSTLFLPYSQIHSHDLLSNSNNSNNHDNHSNSNSTGIGLMICKQMIERLGGTLTCESTLGVGSTFTFTIPFDTRINTITNDIDDRKQIPKIVSENYSRSNPSHHHNNDNRNIIHKIRHNSSSHVTRNDVRNSKSKTFDLLLASEFMAETDDSAIVIDKASNSLNTPTFQNTK